MENSNNKTWQKTLIEKMNDWVESDDGKRYFEEERFKMELKKKRYERFEQWVETIDFDKLIERLTKEHDDNYEQKCRDKGYQVYPNNKLSFLIGYLFNNFESIEVSELSCPFPTTVYFYKGYYFETVYGQGSFHVIYNNKFERVLTV